MSTPTRPERTDTMHEITIHIDSQPWIGRVKKFGLFLLLNLLSLTAAGIMEWVVF